MSPNPHNVEQIRHASLIYSGEQHGYNLHSLYRMCEQVLIGFRVESLGFGRGHNLHSIFRMCEQVLETFFHDNLNNDTQCHF